MVYVLDLLDFFGVVSYELVELVLIVKVGILIVDVEVLVSENG